MLSMVRDDTLEGRRVTGFSSSVELVYDYDSPLHISGSTLEAGSERERERERERVTTISLCSRSCANLSDDFTLPVFVKEGGGGGVSRNHCP